MSLPAMRAAFFLFVVERRDARAVLRLIGNRGARLIHLPVQGDAMESRERSEAVKAPSVWVRERASCVLGLVGVVLFLACAYTPLSNVLAQSLATRSRLEAAGAIVVLAASVSEDGILENSSLRRAVQGIVLQRKGLAPLLVFSGPAPDEGMPEAEVRAALARDLGVLPDAILTESESRTTREEAARIGALLREKQVRRILLVTNSQHMARARRLFERLGLEVLPAPADDVSPVDVVPEVRLKLARIAFQEILARLYDRVAGYL